MRICHQTSNLSHFLGILPFFDRMIFGSGPVIYMWHGFMRRNSEFYFDGKAIYLLSCIPIPVSRNNLRSLRTRILGMGVDEASQALPLPFSSPRWCGAGTCCRPGQEVTVEPGKTLTSTWVRSLFTAPCFCCWGSCGRPGLAPGPCPTALTCKPLSHLTHHYPSKPSYLSNFRSDILNLSWLKCYHLHCVTVSFSPYATNGHNLLQNVKSDTSTEGQNRRTLCLKSTLA